MHSRFSAILLFVLLLSGCAKDDLSLSPVKPTDIISESEAEAAAGEDCDLSLEFNAVVDMGNNTYKASYLANPLGSADPVIVQVTYPSKTFTENDIEKLYADSYKNRINKRNVRGVGSDAFVAFPTLNIYEEGHLITITAGSGDTQEQLELLISLGQTAVENLHEYLKSNK